MKECREIDSLLPAYLDNALSSAEMKLVEGHLSSCSRCRVALDDLKKTMGLLKGMQEVEPPPWFRQRIMSQVTKEAERKKGIIERLFFPLHIKVPVQALATVLIAVLAFHVYKTNEPEVKRMEQAAAPSLELKREQQAPSGFPQKAEIKEEKRAERDSVPPAPGREEKKPVLGFAPAPKGDREVAKRQDRAASDGYVAMQRAPEPPTASVRSYEEMKKAEEPAAGNRLFDRSEEKDTMAAAPRKQKAMEAGREMEAKKGASYAPAAPSITAKTTADAAQRLTIVIRVSDVNSAGDEAAGIMRRYGSVTAIRQSGEQRRILTAEIKARQINDAVDRLRSVGNLRAVGRIPEASEKTVTVRIEIISSE